MCHQETFTNVSFMAMNMVVLDDEHGFLSDIKKPYTTGKADCFQVYRDRFEKPKPLT
jgi:hypothetical protein